MAISHTLLKTKHAKGRCILCNGEVDRATVGNLCNACKDGFATNFDGFAQREMSHKFAM